jgi:threonine aldolase
MNPISFASDTFAPVCEEAMQAIIAANKNLAPSYGSDLYTQRAIELFKQEFDPAIEAFIMLSGTGANVTALKAILRPYESIICAETAHIFTHETGAIYANAGCKLIPLPSVDGKITPDAIADAVQKEQFWGLHSTQPKVVSISQSTEYGTIYTLKELHRISEMCKRHNLLLHIDGCRLYNAAVALDCPLKSLGREAGVDVLSIGGTKNGLMLAEAVIFFNPALAKNFEYVRKQNLQLVSKMRYLSAQFIPFFEQRLWKRNATHANQMARRLYEALKQLPHVTFSQKVETNQLFVILPRKAVEELSKHAIFYIWDEPKGEVRLITSFHTKTEEIDAFVQAIKHLV